MFCFCMLANGSLTGATSGGEGIHVGCWGEGRAVAEAEVEEGVVSFVVLAASDKYSTFSLNCQISCRRSRYSGDNFHTFCKRCW